jgi:hypothetical protein
MPKLFKQRNIDLREFPNLFQMEGHTGGFGFLFAVAWFVLIFFTTPNLSQGHLFGFGFFFMFAFGGLMWLSFWMGDRFADRIRDADGIRSEAQRVARKDQLDDQVRFRITILSGSYVVICCLLIWLTGGLLSPFIPFYIIVFTLTLEKCEVPNPGLYICLGFGFLILLTFAAFWYRAPPISANMTDIIESNAQKGMYVFFVIASLAVPTISKYLLTIEARRKIQEETGRED